MNITRRVAASLLRTPRGLAALALVAALGLGGAAGAWLSLGQAQEPPACAPGSGTRVCVLPASQTVTAGSNVNVDITIDQVVNLGAYEVTIVFDPAVVEFVSASYGPFLSSTGRTPNCFSPAVSAGSVRLSCVTLPPDTGPPGPSGPDGSGVLATANFATVNPGTTLLQLANVIVTDITGAPMAHIDQQGEVTVEPCVGACPTSTPTLTPTATVSPGPGPTIVKVDPPSQDQLTGSTFTVDIAVENVSNLGAYEFGLTWDSGVLSLVSVTNGPFLGSSGRSVFCPDPTTGTNTVRFGCVTAGSTLPGAQGTGVLARLTFFAEAASAGLPSPLQFFNVSLSTPLGVNIATSFQDGAVTVADAPIPTPTPCVGDCPTPTSSPTPTITPTPTPTPLPIPCSPGTGALVCVQPASLAAGQGENFSVDVTADGVSNLGAYAFTLVFDPDVVAFSSVTNGPFLGSSGRSVSCPAPTLTVNSLSFRCVTLGASPPGPNGAGVLATVTFLTLAPGTSPLDLQSVRLVDVQATEIPATGQDGSVTVLAGPTPTPTITPTPGPTFTPTPTVILPTTITRVSPAASTATPGGNFSIDITIEEVTGLASYEWELDFDPAVVGFVSVVNGPFLGSSGRSVFCPPPILSPGKVRFGCATSGLSPSPPSGAGVLSTVTLSALAPGTSALNLAFVSLSDPLSGDIPTQVFGGSVTVGAAPMPPAATPTATPLVQGTPTPGLGLPSAAVDPTSSR